MGVTPLFTDSQYLYVVSYKKPERGIHFIFTFLEDEEEEEKDEGAQGTGAAGNEAAQ